MSRKTTTLKAVVVAAAVAGAAFGIAPAQAADSTGMTITKVGPGKIAVGVATPVSVAGKGFNSTITKIQFTSAAACASTNVVVASATLLYVTSPTDASCVAGLVTSLTLFAGADKLNASWTGTDKTSITWVTPVDVSGTLVSAPSTGIAGTEITITGLASVPTDKAVTATLGGKALQGVKALSASSIKGKVPAGLAPGVADLVVTANGVSSAAKASGFTSALTAKVSPNIFVKGATAPVLKVEGLGFKPNAASLVSATVCGVTAAIASAPGGTGASAVKAATNTALYLTAPTFAAASAGSSGGRVDSTNGGVCVVEVLVDTDGDGSGTGKTADDVASVVTATSGIVYAAY